MRTRASGLAFALGIVSASLCIFNPRVAFGDPADPQGSTLKLETPPPAVPPRAEPSELGFTFGLRGGYSFPMGRAKTTPLGDLVSGAIPITGELGYNIDSHLYVGGYFTYAFAFSPNGANSTCPNDGNTTCKVSQLRFGVVSDWHFLPHGKVDPWVGAGFGYEVLNLVATDSSGATTESAALHGLDVLTLEAGVNFKPRPFYGIGPFVDLALGHYWSSTSPPETTHGWFTLGLRGHTGF